MTKPSTSCASNTPGPPTGGPGTVRRWGLLLAWLVGIWVFVHLVAPQANRLDSVRAMTDHIRTHDIDATAYFYTEIEESGMAEQALRNTLSYSSDGTP